MTYLNHAPSDCARVFYCYSMKVQSMSIRRIKGLFAKNPEYCNSRSDLLMPLIAAKYESALCSTAPGHPVQWMQRLKRVFAMPQGTLS
jgi:hypothetical protein